MDADIIIRNGTVVTSEKTFCSDIIIKDGKIIDITESSENYLTENNIDAQGKYVFPGGIDPHVHMHLSTPAGYSSDNFRSGSIAALYGGTTTLIDFVTPRKDQNLNEAFEERLKDAEEVLTDYSFHVSPIDLHPGIENEIVELINKGLTSFKVYMAYKDTIGLEDDVLKEVMKIIAENDALLTVHAEIGDEIEILRDQFAGQNCLSPEYHALSRPRDAEFKAVKKIIELSEITGCKVYIVHVSTKESVELIENARKRGLNVYGETCPQYLFLDDSKLEGSFKDTAAFVFSPPLRKREDNEALWYALNSGVLQTTGTDHCPFNYEQKRAGENDFRKIPNGAGGVEHRLALLYTYGVLEKRISLNQFVGITSTNSAKIFGMYPRKGEIAVGSDADIVIWDTEPVSGISVKSHKQNCDLNIFEGINIKGCPEYIIKGGKTILHKNVLYLENIESYFLKRTL